MSYALHVVRVWVSLIEHSANSKYNKTLWDPSLDRHFKTCRASPHLRGLQGKCPWTALHRRDFDCKAFATQRTGLLNGKFRAEPDWLERAQRILKVAGGVVIFLGFDSSIRWLIDTSGISMLPSQICSALALTILLFVFGGVCQTWSGSLFIHDILSIHGGEACDFLSFCPGMLGAFGGLSMAQIIAPSGTAVVHQALLPAVAWVGRWLPVFLVPVQVMLAYDQLSRWSRRVGIYHGEKKLGMVSWNLMEERNGPAPVLFGGKYQISHSLPGLKNIPSWLAGFLNHRCSYEFDESKKVGS